MLRQDPLNQCVLSAMPPTHINISCVTLLADTGWLDALRACNITGIGAPLEAALHEQTH